MIAKLKYDWVEGEHGECYVVHKNKTIKDFEGDLLTIKKVIGKNTYHEAYGEREFISCPESYYDLVKLYLEEYGYSFEDSYGILTYDIDDEYDYETEKSSINICRKDTTVRWTEL